MNVIESVDECYASDTTRAHFNKVTGRLKCIEGARAFMTCDNSIQIEWEGKNDEYIEIEVHEKIISLYSCVGTLTADDIDSISAAEAVSMFQHWVEKYK